MRKQLITAREERQLTRKQVAEYLGITDVAYGRIENGVRIGRVETWDKLEDLFGIHQRELRKDYGD